MALCFQYCIQELNFHSPVLVGPPLVFFPKAGSLLWLSFPHPLWEFVSMNRQRVVPEPWFKYPAILFNNISASYCSAWWCPFALVPQSLTSCWHWRDTQVKVFFCSSFCPLLHKIPLVPVKLSSSLWVAKLFYFAFWMELVSHCWGCYDLSSTVWSTSRYLFGL